MAVYSFPLFRGLPLLPFSPGRENGFFFMVADIAGYDPGSFRFCLCLSGDPIRTAKKPDGVGGCHLLFGGNIF